MTIKTNANCKLLAKCSRPRPASPTTLQPLCPQSDAQPTRWRQLVVYFSFCSHFLCLAINYGPAGRHIATYYDQFGAAHTHTHTHQKRSRLRRGKPTHFYYCIQLEQAHSKRRKWQHDQLAVTSCGSNVASQSDAHTNQRTHTRSW